MASKKGSGPTFFFHPLYNTLLLPIMHLQRGEISHSMVRRKKIIRQRRRRRRRRRSYAMTMVGFVVVVVFFHTHMCIFQKSYALLGQTFSKFKMRGSFLGPTFFCTFFCQKYRKNSAAAQKKMCFF